MNVSNLQPRLSCIRKHAYTLTFAYLSRSHISDHQTHFNIRMIFVCGEDSVELDLWKGWSPVMSDMKLTQCFIKRTSYQESNMVVVV